MVRIQDVAQVYLSSFSVVRQPERFDEQVEGASIRSGQISMRGIKPLDAYTKTSVVFTKILPKSRSLHKALGREEEPVFTRAAWQDFNLLAGNHSAPQKSLLNRLKRTRTTVGSCVMATQLVNPHTDAKKIAQQQKITQLLARKQHLSNGLDRAIGYFKRGESSLLSFWQTRGGLHHYAYKKALNRFYFKGMGSLNGSAGALQAWKILKDLFLNNAMFQLVAVLLVCTLFGVEDLKPFNLKYHYTQYAYDNHRTHIKAFITSFQPDFWSYLLKFAGSIFVPFFNILCYTHWDLNAIKEGDFISPIDLYRLDIGANHLKYAIFFKLGWDCVILFLWYHAWRSLQRRRDTINFLALHLIPFQDLVLSARRISWLVARDPAMERAYGHHLSKTRQLLRTKGGGLGELVYNLQRAVLRNRSYFFDYTGRLLATYKLLQAHKNAFSDLIYEMGKVDVQLSLVKLMEETQAYDTKNQLTFGSFEDLPDDRPKLQANGLWHPFLDAKTAVTNDLFMDFNHACFIITGPNAGGKTTYVLAAGVNVILNQAWGIAFAQSFKQTPFHKIISYVNVTQSLAKGLSLAEAGMEVLRKHQEVLDRVKRPMLAIVDEILNGVDPAVAQRYSYKILQNRSKMSPNCLTFVTTHLMNLTELAKEDKRFQNKKVVVKMPGCGGRPYDYTYQIHDGVTDQNIVEMMLREKNML